MPRIIDYPLVLDQMRQEDYKSLYHNSGAFGFAPQTTTHSLGWIGPPDPTLKPAAQALARPLPEPYESNLADRLVLAWRQFLPGIIWVMPKSHWAYELEFGSAAPRMRAALEHIQIDPALLKPRNDAAAIEFAADEIEPLRFFVSQLLSLLWGSDFSLAFPRRKTICTAHHHKQLWWTTAEPALIGQLESLAAG